MNTTAEESEPFARGMNGSQRTGWDEAAYRGRPPPQSDNCSRSSVPCSARELQDCSAVQEIKSAPAEAMAGSEAAPASAAPSRIGMPHAPSERSHRPTARNTCHACAIHVRAAPGPDRCRCTVTDLPARAHRCSRADRFRRSSAAISHAEQTWHAARTRRHLDASSRTPATTKDSASSSQSFAAVRSVAGQCCCAAKLHPGWATPSGSPATSRRRTAQRALFS